MIALHNADALEWVLGEGGNEKFDLIATDPPYAFSGNGAEHEMTATVAIVLRESAKLLKPGGWMLVMCASSWRSTAYMVEALRGVLIPVRIATWCKLAARTKVRTVGWQWTSVNVLAFRNGKSATLPATEVLDHITAEPVVKGRRAQLPAIVADWMIAPFAVPGGKMLDPFAGSGELVRSADRAGMHATGCELTPTAEAAE